MYVWYLKVCNDKTFYAKNKTVKRNASPNNVNFKGTYKRQVRRAKIG